MAEALTRVSELRPEACRSAALSRFSAARMTREYLALYEAIAGANHPAGSGARAFSPLTSSEGAA
jgi:hypothetical protein